MCYSHIIWVTLSSKSSLIVRAKALDRDVGATNLSNLVRYVHVVSDQLTYYRKSIFYRIDDCDDSESSLCCDVSCARSDPHLNGTEQGWYLRAHEIVARLKLTLCNNRDAMLSDFDDATKSKGWFGNL